LKISKIFSEHTGDDDDNDNDESETDITPLKNQLSSDRGGRQEFRETFLLYRLLQFQALPHRIYSVHLF